MHVPSTPGCYSPSVRVQPVASSGLSLGLGVPVIQMMCWWDPYDALRRTLLFLTNRCMAYPRGRRPGPLLEYVCPPILDRGAIRPLNAPVRRRSRNLRCAALSLRAGMTYPVPPTDTYVTIGTDVYASYPARRISIIHASTSLNTTQDQNIQT